jgi:hypothetical protein
MTFCLPRYDAVGAAVRSVNQKHIIFYEPVTWGMVEEGRYNIRNRILLVLWYTLVFVCVRRTLRVPPPFA